jgi:hypothetical protein
MYGARKSTVIGKDQNGFRCDRGAEDDMKIT